MSIDNGGAMVPAEAGHVPPPAVLRAVFRCALAVVLLIGLMLFVAALSSAAERPDSGVVSSGMCAGSTRAVVGL